MLRLFLLASLVLVQCAAFSSKLGAAGGKKSYKLSSDEISDDDPRYIYYMIKDGFSNYSIEMIYESLDHYETQTCLWFVWVDSLNSTNPSVNDSSFILIFMPALKKSNSSIKPYYIDEKRNIIYIPINEREELEFNGIKRLNQQLYYALGFSPENLRPDRDNYVTVSWENIRRGYKKLFLKDHFDTALQLPYDFRSVSHYYPEDFARTIGLTTLLPKHEDSTMVLGWNTELSSLDVYKISYQYCQGSDSISSKRNHRHSWISTN